MKIVAKLKSACLKIDLLIVYAKAMKDNAISRMQLYYGQTSKRKKKRFLVAKIDLERYNVYLEELIRQKSELLKNIELVFDKHNKRFKKIFVMYYIDNKSVVEIANELGYSNEAVSKIICEIDNELARAYK